MNNEEKILALLEQHSEMFAAMGARFDKMDARMDELQKDVAHLKGDMEQVKGRLDRLEDKVDRLEDKVDRLEEYSEVTRDGVNALLDWAEACSETYRLPLPKVGQC